MGDDGWNRRGRMMILFFFITLYEIISSIFFMPYDKTSASLILFDVFKIVIGAKFAVFLLKTPKWGNLTERIKRYYSSIFVFVLLFAVTNTMNFINPVYAKSYSIFYLTLILIIATFIAAKKRISEPYLSKAFENSGLLWKEEEVKRE